MLQPTDNTQKLYNKIFTTACVCTARSNILRYILCTIRLYYSRHNSKLKLYGKFTAIKTNLSVIYVTKSYLHKKFIYNLFKLQSFLSRRVSQTHTQFVYYSLSSLSGLQLQSYIDSSHFSSDHKKMLFQSS